MGVASEDDFPAIAGRIGLADDNDDPAVLVDLHPKDIQSRSFGALNGTDQISLPKGVGASETSKALYFR